MLDLEKPVWFYDGSKNRDDLLRLTEVLWQDERFILCKVLCHEYSDSLDRPLDFMAWPTSQIDQPILFHHDDWNVLNEDYSRWYATNDLSDWKPFGWEDR